MEVDLDVLSQNFFFKNFSKRELSALLQFSKMVHFKDGSSLFREGEQGEEFFLVIDGTIEIVKDQIHLALIHKGEVVGEMAAVAKSHRRIATALAKTSCTLLRISLEELAKHPETKEMGAQIQLQFLQVLTERARGGADVAVVAIQNQLKQEKARSHLGNCLIYLLLLIFFYIYSIRFLDLLQIQVLSSTVISVPILIVFVLAMMMLVRKTDYPWSDYGFTSRNWGKQLISSFFWTIPMVLLLVLMKWAAIRWVAEFHDLHLISISPALGENVPYTPLLFVILVVAYLVFVPVQEIIYRGFMQNVLEKLLLSKRNTLIAILVSNLPFSMIHLHLSFSLTLGVYFWGLIWGWMYAKQRSLVGCTFSHLILGFFGFFILGFQDILRM